MKIIQRRRICVPKVSNMLFKNQECIRIKTEKTQRKKSKQQVSSWGHVLGLNKTCNRAPLESWEESSERDEQ